MRRVFSSLVRGVVSVSVILALSASVAAAQRDDRGPREGPITRIVKKIIKSLGDGLVIPLP
jgi:hypothetical protein